MRTYSAINNVLVHVPESFESTLKTRSGLSFLKDTYYAGVPDTVRYGLVVSSGVEGIKENDIVFFHHNIVYEQIGHLKQRVRSDYLVDGEHHIYYIPDGQELMYAIERNGIFQALDGWCFVKQKVTQKESDLRYSRKSKEHVGVVRYPSRSLKKKGIKVGDEVVFKFNSEYVYKIYDELMYRVREPSILAKIDG